jgi:hypothetical protein
MALSRLFRTSPTLRLKLSTMLVSSITMAWA